MSTASPSAFLLWAILSVLFLAFLIYHLWGYDRFQCLRWSAGKQPGAFKRVMTYSYIATLPLLVVYSVATTVIKYNEGFIVYTEPGVHIMPRPPSMYSHRSRVWVLPLNFVFSIAWALELVTHLEELAFWLYLLNQAPEKAEWFESWEYRLWYLGSIVAILGLPLTCMIARRNLDTVDAWIFLAGSAGGLGTTVVFLYVLLRFPRFLRHVKAEGADPTVVVRLATNYQLNLARVVFRFLFAVPLLMLAISGIVGTRHPLNTNLFSTDFLQMIGGIGCFVSSAITLLIFFPRSIIREEGYKPRLASTLQSPKSAPPSPLLPFSPATSHFPRLSESADDSALDVGHLGYVEQPPYQYSSRHPSHSPYHYQFQYQYGEPSQAQYEQEDTLAPPYPHAMLHTHSAGSHPHGHLHQRHPFPHSLSSPQISPPASAAEVVLPPPAQLERAGSCTLPRHQRAASMYVLRAPQAFRSSAPTPAPTLRLHPYVMTFTSPIDLVDLTAAEEFPRTMG